MILVTGGLGYLGGRICEFLINSGKKVRIGTSRLGVSIPEQLNECDIVKIDLLDPQSLDSACQGVTSIIHLAALNAKASSLDPKQALMINGMGTLNLLSSAISNKVEKFLYFSTIHVYGSQLHGEINEDTLTKPMHHYSITHKLAEDYVLEANETNSISGSVFRLSNVIGSPLNKEANCWMLVAQDLCKQVVMHKSMQLSSSPYIERDFIGITNIFHIVSNCISNDDIFQEIRGDIFNITNGSPFSLGYLSELIMLQSKKVLGYAPEIKFNTSSEVKEKSLIFSNQKAKNIGFKLESNLPREIDSLLLNCKKWFKS